MHDMIIQHYQTNRFYWWLIPTVFLGPILTKLFVSVLTGLFSVTSTSHPLGASFSRLTSFCMCTLLPSPNPELQELAVKVLLRSKGVRGRLVAHEAALLAMASPGAGSGLKDAMLKLPLEAIAESHRPMALTVIIRDSPTNWIEEKMGRSNFGGLFLMSGYAHGT